MKKCCRDLFRRAGDGDCRDIDLIFAVTVFIILPSFISCEMAMSTSGRGDGKEDIRQVAVPVVIVEVCEKALQFLCVID